MNILQLKLCNFGKPCMAVWHMKRLGSILSTRNSGAIKYKEARALRTLCLLVVLVPVEVGLR
jgi:hypothetical protein